MKYKIDYHSIQSDHVLARPEFEHSEIVEADSEEKLTEYILKQKDSWGHHFEKRESYGFSYVSSCGGVKVEEYKEPEEKKI